MRLDVLLFLLLCSATALTTPSMEGRENGGASGSLSKFLADINFDNYLDLFMREELLPMITESQFE